MQGPFRSLIQDGVVRSTDDTALNATPLRITKISLRVPVKGGRGPKAMDRKLVGGFGCAGVSSLPWASFVRLALRGLPVGFSIPISIFWVTLLLLLGRRHHECTRKRGTRRWRRSRVQRNLS